MSLQHLEPTGPYLGPTGYTVTLFMYFSKHLIVKGYKAKLDSSRKD